MRPPQPDSQGESHFAPHEALAFPHASAALDREIDRRSEEIESGPIGNRAKELASLRLVSTAGSLLESGSDGGALAALERAVSLDGANGYALLWMAFVVSRTSEPRARARAFEFAERALGALPRDREVIGEAEQFRDSLRAGMP